MTPKSQISVTVDAALRHAVTPLLKAHSYRKAGRTYHDQRAPVVTVINFQSSTWNNPDSARFTINLRITFPFYHTTRSGTPYPNNPSNADAFVNRRIGFTMPEARDYWWSVTADTEPTSLGTAVSKIIDEHAIPFLDRHADLAFIRDILQKDDQVLNHGSNRHIDLAILHAYNGDIDEATSLIDEQLSVAKANNNSAYERNLLGVLGRLTRAS